MYLAQYHDDTRIDQRSQDRREEESDDAGLIGKDESHDHSVGDDTNHAGHHQTNLPRKTRKESDMRILSV